MWLLLIRPSTDNDDGFRWFCEVIRIRLARDINPVAYKICSRVSDIEITFHFPISVIVDCHHFSPSCCAIVLFKTEETYSRRRDSNTFVYVRLRDRRRTDEEDRRETRETDE